MEHSMSRILIETTVRQTLKGLKENPKRNIRNLVDMVLQFSKGRFQSRFFQTAHTMLENQDSAYYALIQDAAGHIETEHLVKFGMNLGYNSCTWGARQIRLNEARLGFNIPWTVLFQMCPPQYTDHLSQYDSAITAGEELGIYSWMLLTDADPSPLLPLIQKHADSAFFLFCQPEAVTTVFLEEISEIKHLMSVICWKDGADCACTMLREKALPYSVYCPYSQKDVEPIVNGTLFCSTQQLHPIFTALVPRPGCPLHIRKVIHQAAVSVRTGQYYQTVPWELYYDTRSLDEVISDDACCVCFDGIGNLYIPDEPAELLHGNLFTDGFTSLIQRTCPKSSPISKA